VHAWAFCKHIHSRTARNQKDEQKPQASNSLKKLRHLNAENEINWVEALLAHCVLSMIKKDQEVCPPTDFSWVETGHSREFSTLFHTFAKMHRSTSITLNVSTKKSLQ
jgi:hypothetical protein